MFLLKEQSLRQNRNRLLLALLVLQVFFIGAFMLLNISAGRTIFLINNAVLMLVTAAALFLLHSRRYRAAMLTGVALYSFELQGFILLTHHFIPLHYSNYSFNISLVLGLSAILGAAFLAEKSADFALVYLPSLGFILADYYFNNIVHFAPAFLSLVTLLFMSGIAAVLFIHVTARMKVLIEEKNYLLAELSQEKEHAEHALRMKSRFFQAPAMICVPLCSPSGVLPNCFRTPMTPGKKMTL